MTYINHNYDLVYPSFLGQELNEEITEIIELQEIYNNQTFDCTDLLEAL